MKWTQEKIDLLTEFYPKMGKAWCVENLGLTEAQIRQKASRLGLSAMGKSVAWQEKQKTHAKKLTGRKRPEQALVIKKLHQEGKLIYTEERKKATSERMKNWHKNNNHPKGFKNEKHTNEAKEKMSQSSLSHWKTMTEEDKENKIFKTLQTKVKNNTLIQNRTKVTWKASWQEIGGKRKFYRSRWESNYAKYLEWLKQKGQIQDWQHEPKTFWFEGIKRGCVSYLPDFCVTELNGKEVYHEVKGWMDDRSITKIKRMAKYHPNVTLVVIDSKAYKELAKKISFLIDGWEL